MTLTEMMEKGKVKAGTMLRANYKGQTLKARINKDGTVNFDGTDYTSLSTAAVAAKNSVEAESVTTTNGWTFWKARAEVTLCSLR